ncbi:unnamed protein product, partial [Brenthis ino]
MFVGSEYVPQRQNAVSAAVSFLLATCFIALATAEEFQEYDFVIVGGGSAGSVIADRLSECPFFDVLVIEAGDEPGTESILPGLFSTLPHTRYDWNFTSVNDNRTAQDHTIKALNLTCGHVLGGGSSINYMFYVRGCPKDYDSWAEVASDASWNYTNIFKYFLKSENLKDPSILNSEYRKYHGTTGFLGITRGDRNVTKQYLKAFEEVGHKILFDVNGEEKLGYTLPLFTIADGIRQSTAIKNLQANKHRPNLHVSTLTLVTEILFENNIAIGVKALTEANEIIIIKARKEIIISAGGINSPKLLMLSGIGPREHLESLDISVRSDLPVGYNFQDHISAVVTYKMEKTNASTQPEDLRKFPPLIIGYGALNQSEYCPAYQVLSFIESKGSSLSEICKFTYGFKESICNKLLTGAQDRNLLSANLNLLHPRSRGRVLLKSVNPRDPPLVITNAFANERDLEDLTDSMIDYIKVLNSTYFKSVQAELVDLELERCPKFDISDRAYWKCYVQSMMYYSSDFAGTCAMGKVVDSKLRVHNIERLRVADGSIMPSLTSGNINAPVIMIAEKLADIVKQAHSCRHSKLSCIRDLLAEWLVSN